MMTLIIITMKMMTMMMMTMMTLSTDLITISSHIAIDPGSYRGSDQSLVIHLEGLQQPVVLPQHVLLVVILSVVESFSWQDLGGDVAPVLSLGRLERCLCQRFLLFIVVENHRHILTRTH